MPPPAYLVLATALVACRPPVPQPASAPSPMLTSDAAVSTTPAADAGAPSALADEEETLVVDAGPPGCAEAHGLTQVDLASTEIDHEVAFELPERSDDITEYTASGKDRAELPPHVTDDKRTYSLEGQDNAIVARDGDKVAWRAAGHEVAGGIFFVSLSPAGHIVARTYSRGTTELFDARTGALYASHVGPALIFDPSDRYALDLPALQVWTTQKYNRAEVHKISFARGPATIRSPVRLPIDSEKEYDSHGMPYFGAAVCATGALYVVSHPDGELAIYRAKDDAKLAHIPHPPSGYPAFTWSGRFVFVRHPHVLSDDPEGIAAVYRIEGRGPPSR